MLAVKEPSKSQTVLSSNDCFKNLFMYRGASQIAGFHLIMKVCLLSTLTTISSLLNDHQTLMAEH